MGSNLNTLLSLGHGYSAQALVRLLGSDWRVIGTTRSVDKADQLRAQGIETIVTPAEDIDTALSLATHLLVSAGPTEEGDPMLSAYPQISKADFAWVGYLSTTGVYGDHAGGWVDEETPLTPSTRRGQWRKEAEAAWISTELPLHIFRLAGIYGPGRGPFSKVRAGTARRIIKPGQVFSRIHVDDIAQVLKASIERPNPVRAYNLCDDDPAPPQDVIAHAAELLGVPVPPDTPIDEAEMTPMARSFYSESKRVRNDRIKVELGVRLLYPSYRDGLVALLSAEGRDR